MHLPTQARGLSSLSLHRKRNNAEEDGPHDLVTGGTESGLRGATGPAGMFTSVRMGHTMHLAEALLK